MESESTLHVGPLASAVAAASCLFFAGPLQAQDLYWDSNGTTAGFGNTGGTWGTSAFWNTNSGGGSGTFGATTTSSDIVNFGTAAASNNNYNNATVEVAAGGVFANSIVYGANQWRGINLGTTGNSITLVGGTVSNNNASAVQTIISPLAGTALTKSGSGVLALAGANTYTGGTAVNAGTLVFRNLASKTADTHTFAAGTTLGLGVGDTGFFTTADVDNAFSGTVAGNLGNITWNPATNIGIDTTAGNLSYTTDIGPVGRGLAKLGANTLTLGDNNAYTGATVLQGGQLDVSILGNAGSISSIGAFATAGPTGLLLRGGVFNYTGTNVTTNRGFTTSGIGNTISVQAGQSLTLGTSIKSDVNTGTQSDALRFNATGAGASIIIDDLTITAGSSADFNLARADLNVTINNLRVTGSNVIAQRENQGPGTHRITLGNVIGTGASGWFSEINITGEISGYTGGIFLGNHVSLTGLSSFNASVTLQQAGGYTFNSIKNVGGGASALGNPLTVANGTIGFGNGTNTPTFRYTGTGDTTDRVMNLRGTTGNPTLEHAGTGLLKFTSNFTATGGGTKTLRLAGSTTGTGEIAGAIVNNSVTNLTNLEKTGTGTWILSGANTYTGATTVTAGTLALVGGSQTSPITVTPAGALGFTLGSPTTSTSTVTFAAGSKVAITGTPAAPTAYLLMTAAGGISGAPGLATPIPGYFVETRNSGTELWLDFNPNIQTHVINLGAGTAIAGGTFGTYAGPITGLPLPALPVGTILRSVEVNTTLTATDAGNFASDLNLLFDPTPGTPGVDFILAFAASDATPPVFGTNNVLSWSPSANGGIGTNVADFKTETAWTGLAGAIDLSTTGLFLGNNYGTAPEGGTWSGTITLTYELPGSPPGPYDTWTTEKGLIASNNAKDLDPDNDGRNNLAEFALDGNPLSGVTDGKLLGKVATVGGEQVLTLTLPVRTGATFSNSGGDQLSAPIDGVTYRIEGDGNLSSFADIITEVTGGDASAIQAGLPALSTGWNYRTFRSPGTVPAVPKAFLRAQISQTP